MSILADADSAGGVFSLFRAGVVSLLLPRDRRTAALTLDLYQPARGRAVALKKFAHMSNSAGILRFMFPQCAAGVDPRKGWLLANHTKPSPAILSVDAVTMTVTKHGLPGSGVAAEGARIAAFNNAGIPGIANVLRYDTKMSESFATPYYPPANLRTLRDRRVERLLLSWLGAGFFHGDFAPWNLRLDDGGKLLAVDLECSRIDPAMAGMDLCYGLLREAMLVRRLAPDAAEKWVLASAAFFPEYMRASGWEGRVGEWLKRGKEYYAQTL